MCMSLMAMHLIMSSDLPAAQQYTCGASSMRAMSSWSLSPLTPSRMPAS